MTKRSLIFAATLVASMSIAGAASAQESAFEGFYVGGQVGYSIINVELSDATGSFDDDMDGFGGGGFIGFGGTNGQIYGAIEAELGYDGAQWDISGPVPPFGTGTIDVEAKLTYGVGFRAGAVVADKYLIYGRLGYVRTNVELEASVTGLGSASDDEDFNGFRFGGGFEGIVWENVSARAEYTYTIYDDPDVFPGVDIDANQHLFRVGVAYYF